MVAEASDRELRVARIFDGPRSLVFEAWTTREHLVHCWGQKTPARPSAKWTSALAAHRFCMRSLEGRHYWVRGIYGEIVALERIVWTARPEDETSADAELFMSIIFDDLGGKCRVTVHQAPFKTVVGRDGHVRGWTESLERHAVHVAGQ